MRSERTRPAHRRRAAITAVVIAATTLAACGDDESAQDRYCAAGDSLASSVSALVSLDLIAEGTNGLQSAVDDVLADVESLRDAASDAAADEVEALENSVESLSDSLGSVGDELSEENVSGVVAAIGEIQTSFGAVTDTLSDC